MQNKPLSTNKQVIANSFAKAAATYDQAAAVEQEIGSRLIDRLAIINLQPQHILDLGCGTGYITKQLHTQYPNATIIGLDLALPMVKIATNNTGLLYCCADAEQLPFPDQQFELIFSNCCFYSISDLSRLFNEIKRTMRQDAALLFTTLGPSTLHEFGLQPRYQDMHNIGDILTSLGYKNPVLDTEYLTFSYKNLRTLLNDLTHTGTYQINLEDVDNLDAPCNATFEVIYGIAWQQESYKKPTQVKDQFGNTYIPVTEIKKILS